MIGAGQHAVRGKGYATFFKLLVYSVFRPVAIIFWQSIVWNFYLYQRASQFQYHHCVEVMRAIILALPGHVWSSLGKSFQAIQLQHCTWVSKIIDWM
jgi:hypothetical protein